MGLFCFYIKRVCFLWKNKIATGFRLLLYVFKANTYHFIIKAHVNCFGAIYFFVKAYLFKVNAYQLVTIAIDAEAVLINIRLMLYHFKIKAYHFKAKAINLKVRLYNTEAMLINTMFMLHYFITKTHAKCFRAIGFIANTYLLIVNTCVFATFMYRSLINLRNNFTSYLLKPTRYKKTAAIY